MSDFKVGDRVRAKKITPYFITKDGWEGTVIKLFTGKGNDIEVRDEDGDSYSVESRFFDLVTPAKGKRGRPRTKPKPVKFLLKYDLDEDPIEEFSTLDEVRERIDYLVKNESSLKRDSMIVYEIKKRWTASVSTKIKLSK